MLAKDYGQTDDDGNLIGAALLKLINTGCLEPLQEKSVGFFGKEKESISLRLIHPPQYRGVTTKLIYDLLVLASKSDQILQEHELEEYCSMNHTAVMLLVDNALNDGNSTLAEIYSYDNSKAAQPLGLSQRGENLLLKIMGFKKFLLEFSLIGERTIAESLIWQDYLVFATLFGIADKAIEQFAKVYPDATKYCENARYYYQLAHRYTQASYQAARAAGSGGSSSHDGGGGTR